MTEDSRTIPRSGFSSKSHNCHRPVGVFESDPKEVPLGSNASGPDEKTSGLTFQDLSGEGLRSTS